MKYFRFFNFIITLYSGRHFARFLETKREQENKIKQTTSKKIQLPKIKTKPPKPTNM